MEHDTKYSVRRYAVIAKLSLETDLHKGHVVGIYQYDFFFVQCVKSLSSFLGTEATGRVTKTTRRETTRGIAKAERGGRCRKTRKG